jgi:hypothetical protein
MTIYSLVLFLHVGAALTVASALSIDALILFELRGSPYAATHSRLKLWSRVPRITGTSGVVLLLSGGYLTHQMSALTLAWPKVALAALILIGILGAVSGSRISVLLKVCAAGQARESEFIRRLQDPLLNVSLCARIALLFAAVLLMNAKPDLWQSLAIIGVSVVLGLAVAFVIPRSESRTVDAVG